MFDLIYRFDPEGRHTADSPKNADEALRRLEMGNRLFARLLAPGEETGSRVIRLDADDLGLPRPDGSAPSQQPFAAVLGCSDARVPTEMVFGQTCNDLFVVRVAGNVLGAECLGSLDYAIANLKESLKLIVVLGHSGCGAVTAGVDAFMSPDKYLQVASSHPLRAVVDRIFVAARLAHAALEGVYGQQVEELPGYRQAMIETAVALNAAMTAATLRHEFADRLGPDRQVVYGVYDLVTRRVKLELETGDSSLAIRLVTPPADSDGFAQLGLLVAGSGSVREKLG